MTKWTLSIFFTILSLSIFGQSGTTLEEYRYLTKGYAYQLEMGLDAHKDQYNIREIYRSGEEVQFVGLYRNGDPRLRGLLAIIGDRSPNPKYLCIPNRTAAEDIRKIYRNDKAQLLTTADLRRRYEKALTELLLQSLDQGPEALSFDLPEEEQAAGKGIELTSKGIPIEQPSGNRPGKQRPPEMNYIESNTSRTEAAAVATEIGEGLENRPLDRMPQISGKASAKGKVVIKLCVDRYGHVTQAKFTQRGSTTFNSQLRQLALESVRSLNFSENDLPEQCGVISFHFK